jgi:hypothetical protein
MKTSVITILVAAPLLSLSSMAFAAEPASAEPVLLSAVEMDGITAGTYSRNYARVWQVNESPVTIVQISYRNRATGGEGGEGNSGGGIAGNNTAFVASGNFLYLRQ